MLDRSVTAYIFITANVKRSLHVMWAKHDVPYLD